MYYGITEKSTFRNKNKQIITIYNLELKYPYKTICYTTSGTYGNPQIHVAKWKKDITCDIKNICIVICGKTCLDIFISHSGGSSDPHSILPQFYSFEEEELLENIKDDFMDKLKNKIELPYWR